MRRLSVQVARLATAGALAASTLLGCEGDSKPTAGLSLEIHAAGWEQGDFDPLNQATAEDRLEIVAARPGAPEAEAYTQVFDLAERSGTLSDLPIDKGYRLLVRGLRGTPGQLIFYGGSPFFDIEEGKTTRVAIQVGKPDCVMLNHKSQRESFFVVNGSEDAFHARWGAASVVLQDGRVLITGGGTVNREGNLTELRSDIEIYDPRYGQFFFGDESLRLQRPLAHHTATLLKDGRVLIFGGLTTENMQPVKAPDIQIINVNDATQKVRVSNVAVPEGLTRHMHAAARLEKDGSVLFSGGLGPDGKPTDSVARFFPDPVDPLGGTLSEEGHMQDARVNHAMTPLLREGTLALVSGGQGADGEPLSTMEVMVVGANQTECVEGTFADATHGCWVPNPFGLAMAQPRFGHRVVPVGAGHQLVFVGGYASRDRATMVQDLELLDTKYRSGANEVFAFVGANAAAGEVPAGRLATGRGEFGATPLIDGRILLSGGRQGRYPVKTTSILAPCNGGAAAGCTTQFVETELPGECALSQPRYGHEALLLHNGTVLFTGGVSAQGQGDLTALRRAEVYFPRVLEPCDVLDPCPPALVSGGQ